MGLARYDCENGGKLGFRLHWVRRRVGHLLDAETGVFEGVLRVGGEFEGLAS